MARSSKARGKTVRHLGINIFGNPKYDRLLKKKPYGPGEPKKGRIRETEYARQLKEKQKVKFAYGLSERQFRNLFYKAKVLKGVTGHNMLILLERRLDNVVYRMGMAASRRQARQLVGHGHIHLNGRKVTIPSALVRPGDKISVKSKKRFRDAHAPARVGKLVAASSAVDRGFPRRPHRHRSDASDAGYDSHHRRGAADRRVLLEVKRIADRSTPRESAAVPKDEVAEGAESYIVAAPFFCGYNPTTYENVQRSSGRRRYLRYAPFSRGVQ